MAIIANPSNDTFGNIFSIKPFGVKFIIARRSRRLADWKKYRRLALRIIPGEFGKQALRVGVAIGKGRLETDKLLRVLHTTHDRGVLHIASGLWKGTTISLSTLSRNGTVRLLDIVMRECPHNECHAAKKNDEHDPKNPEQPFEKGPHVIQ